MGCMRRRMRLVGGATIAMSFFVLIQLLKAPKSSYGEDVMIPLKSRHTNQEEYIDHHGIHVVVGHYMGEETPGAPAPNLTEEILNSNGFDPQKGAGAQGAPVQVSTWEGARMQLLYHINKFNLLASDRIPLNRSLPDVRKKHCESISYASLPTTSVVIVFHNEAWSTLLRTVHSVINRSPSDLLKEIILVDDNSQRSFLKGPLEEHVSRLAVPVTIIRSPERTGLIRARLLGAKKAGGEVLTFLDAHCEVTKGWLEPLLSRIAEDRTRVVCPIIDIIHEDTFQFVRSFELHWGAFNWNLHFRWYALGRQAVDHRKEDITQAYKTPAMAGGLFSIDRNYFYELGSYDDTMDIWGGENLEMSFRVWMCGGSVEIAPCSHVGHVFRKSSPYTFPGEGGVGGVLYRNLARVALVWLDEWSNFYFRMNPDAAKVRNSVSVNDRLKLRERLQCKSFAWYLDNVWPEHFFPTANRFFGKIRHEGQSKCIQKPVGSGNQPTGPAILQDCVVEIYPTQSFVFTPKGFIMTDESVCLDVPDSRTSRSPQVRVMACNEYERQKWTYDSNTRVLKHILSGKCLAIAGASHPTSLTLDVCEENHSSQKWVFQHENWNRTYT